MVACERMKQSSKFFYILVKSKSTLHAPISPFTDDDGNLIYEKPCEILNQTYFDIFDQPSKKDILLAEYIDNEEDLMPEKEEHMDKDYFIVENIKKAIMKTMSEAPGTSVITPQLVKKTADMISPILHTLYKKNLKERNSLPTMSLFIHKNSRPLQIKFNC